jgi:hypothetical protein
MIASILHLPHGTPASEQSLLDRFAATPGLLHFFQLVPGEGEGDRLGVAMWESEQALDAYIESDLGQQVLRDNPDATRVIYTVNQVK